jgi:hypothetical protein
MDACGFSASELGSEDHSLAGSEEREKATKRHGGARVRQDRYEALKLRFAPYELSPRRVDPPIHSDIVGATKDGLTPVEVGIVKVT